MTTPSLPDRTDGTATGAGGAPPFAAPAGEGELIDIGTAAFLVRATADSTGGVLTMFEELPPLLDTSRHVHRQEDETFYVLDGEHEFTSGDRIFRLGPGGVAFLPRGIPHAHRRLVPGVGRLLCVTTPAGFERFFRDLAEAARSGEPPETAYARASERAGITWLD
jgi:mannose-6-phosphate isomerase-like protein (cupin superfamily)